jgi:hypothetical protein
MGQMTDTLTLPSKPATTHGDLLLHGVHMECQPLEPYWTACGLVVDESDRDTGSRKDRCVVCWQVSSCQFCGTLLVPETAI